jgi:hypothetical protein
MANPVNQVRWEQAGQEVSTFKGEFDSWLLKRRQKDELEQYKTQLDALQALFDRALTAAQSYLQQINLKQHPTDVYGECYLLDLRLLWLQRVWRFFREKFDQRDDPELGKLLKAADEVVWSCHRQAFEQAALLGIDYTPCPAPLPYVEPNYSPEAILSDLVPQTLKLEVDGQYLSEYLSRLPVSVVRLPPGCVRGPWWLVLIAHEVGHTVQFRLLKEFKLVNEFRKVVRKSIADQGGNANEEAAWSGYSNEIFADIFSVLAAGPWAVRAMAELELKSHASMIKPRTGYPLVPVRLKLLLETARQYGMDRQGLLGELTPEELAGGDLQACRDLDLVPGLVKTVKEVVLPGLPDTLAEVVRLRTADFQPGGKVDDWADSLWNEQADLPVEEELRSARLMAGASLAAWTRLAAETDPDKRADKRLMLAERARASIANCRVSGTRAGEEAAADIERVCDQFTDLLFRAGQQELETQGGVV